MGTCHQEIFTEWFGRWTREDLKKDLLNTMEMIFVEKGTLGEVRKEEDEGVVTIRLKTIYGKDSSKWENSLIQAMNHSDSNFTVQETSYKVKRDTPLGPLLQMIRQDEQIKKYMAESHTQSHLVLSFRKRLLKPSDTFDSLQMEQRGDSNGNIISACPMVPTKVLMMGEGRDVTKFKFVLKNMAAMFDEWREYGEEVYYYTAPQIDHHFANDDGAQWKVKWYPGTKKNGTKDADGNGPLSFYFGPFLSNKNTAVKYESVSVQVNYDRLDEQHSGHKTKKELTLMRKSVERINKFKFEGLKWPNALSQSRGWVNGLTYEMVMSMLDKNGDFTFSILVERPTPEISEESTTTKTQKKGKTAADELTTTLTIRVKDQSGDETFFKMKKTTKMSKVFTAYAQRKGVAMTSLCFLLDGDVMDPDGTPTSLDLEDQVQSESSQIPFFSSSIIAQTSVLFIFIFLFIII